jgi:hypothetical protein
MFCIVRMVLHESPAGSKFPTTKIREHEERHFEIIRRAWVDNSAKVSQALEKLAQKLNKELNLAGDETYRLEVETPTLPFRINQLPANAKEEGPLHWGAIPQSQLVKDPMTGKNELAKLSAPNHLIAWHSNPKYQRVDYRIVRHQKSPKKGKELHEALTDKATRDPNKLDTRFKEANAQWKTWLDNVYAPIQNEFEREFLAKGMEFDIEQGSFDHNSGRPQPRPELKPLLRRFREATDGPENAAKDPSEELDRLQGVRK